MNDNVFSKCAGKKVLVTGGLGFIGSNLAIRCVELGTEVTIYDCLDKHSGGNAYNIESIRNDIALHQDDILDYGKLCEHVQGHDVIINCAASTSHPHSMREPWMDLDVNSKGVINLLEAVRHNNPEARVVHIGTTTQVGPMRYSPIDELHPEFPSDIYSANKSVSEKYALIYARAYGLRTSVVRLSNVFGPRGSIHSSDFTFNNFFIGLALQGKTISVYGDGSQMRNVLYVDDAVSALLHVSLCEELVGKTVFAVGDHHYSVADIARATTECMGGDVAFVEWPEGRKATDVGDAIISNARLKELTLWQPSRHLEDGLIMTKEYFSGHMKHYIGDRCTGKDKR